jgi:hypothetical protein
VLKKCRRVLLEIKAGRESASRRKCNPTQHIVGRVD